VLKYLVCRNEKEYLSEGISRLSYSSKQHILIDGEMHYCNPMSKESQQDTYKALSDLGVVIKLNC
jgi:NADH dehydrogenase